MAAPALLARWDDFSKGHWGTLGARFAPKGAWGGRNVVVTNDGHLAPVSASRPFVFDNLAVGQINGIHWAWGTDGLVYFLQELVASQEGLTLPGTSGAYAHAPDAAAWNVSGVMRLIARVKLTDWTPADNMSLFAHSMNTGNQRSFFWRVTTGGALDWNVSADGTTVVTQASSVLGFTNDTTHWVGVEYNTGTGAVTFYRAADSIAPPTVFTDWTQVSTHTIAATALFNSTATLAIGGTDNGTNNRLVGTFYRGTIYDDGVVIANPDFSPTGVPLATAGTSSYTDSAAAVWTVAGTAAIAGVASAGDYQLRRFDPNLGDIQTPITIENVGSPVDAPARIPDWFESGGKLYMTIWSDKTYEITPSGPSMAALTGGPGDAPGGRTVCVYGERMMIGGIDDARFGAAQGNMVVYSDAADFTSWPTDNFFKAGADPSEIGGLYNMSDVLVIVFADQQIWTYRGTPGGAASLRRAYGFHSGAGGTEGFMPRDGAVDPSQNRVWIYDHAARCLARFSGTQFARVPGFGVTTITRAGVASVSGGVIAIGGPDEVFVDQVPMPRTEGESAAGDNLEMLRVNGVSSLIERAVVAGS